MQPLKVIQITTKERLPKKKTNMGDIVPFAFSNVPILLCLNQGGGGEG